MSTVLLAKCILGKIASSSGTWLVSLSAVDSSSFWKKRRYLLRDTHSYLTCYLVSVFTLLLLCFRSEESLSVLLHLHHVHQGSVGWREDIGRLCSRIQGSSSRGIRKWLHSLKSTLSVPAGFLFVTTLALFVNHELICNKMCCVDSSRGDNCNFYNKLPRAYQHYTYLWIKGGIDKDI